MAAPGARLPAMKKPSLLVIFLTVFIDLIGFGIVLPLLPRYSERFGASGFMIGLIIASFSAMQFLLAPAWGRWSDRIGRRPVILISNLGSVGSYVMFALAAWPGLPAQAAIGILLASRLFAGACGANLSVASAYIADITPPDKRSKSMGLIGVAFGLGFILGPAIGALSARQFGLAGPGWVAASLCAVNFLLTCFILVESRHPGTAAQEERPGLKGWRHILARPKVGLLVGLFSLSTFCFACYESTLPLLLGSSVFNYTEEHIGYIFAYCGLVSVFIQGGVIGRLVKRFGEKKVIFSSLVLMALSLALLPYTRGLGGLLAALGLFSIGAGINRAPTMGLLSMYADPREQGATMGVAQSAGTLARVVGPVLATSFYVTWPHATYLGASAVAGVTALIAWRRLLAP